MRLHHLLFIAFTIIAGTPIAVLAVWESRSSFQNEFDSVRERHLLVARNLTTTLTRYVKDVQAVFGLAFESGALTHPVAGLTDLLTSLNVIHIWTLAPDGHIETELPGLSADSAAELPQLVMTDLRTLAATAHGQIALSNLYHDEASQPVFYLVKSLPNGRLGVGVISTTYLVSLQQAIAFGDHGHAVMVDAKGQVIAHPIKDWVRASRDISGVPVVAAMMRGETGVGQFYSPAFSDNMIAGYAVVPETGWGVMVPQPISELKRRAGQVNAMATVIAAGSFFGAALMAWVLALYLTRPVRAIAATAEAMLRGDDDVAVPDFRGLIPYEIRRLGEGFNAMLQGLRQRAAETTQALRDAESSNAAKSQFLANMSHEIRTPLNGVVGMIELLQLTELALPQRRYVETAAQSSQSLLRLVDDILDLSRIEAGRLELEQSPFYLPALIDDVRMLFSDQIRAKGLTFSTSVPDALKITVVGDKHRLLQILTNLVGNALKFTPEGIIRLRTAMEHAAGEAMRLRFEVSDTGIGIPTDKQAMIFDAFTQGDSSMTRRFGGTGLGLSIARQLSHMMGGEIGVDSTLGRGSTFWFTMVVHITPSQATPTQIAPIQTAPAQTAPLQAAPMQASPPRESPRTMSPAPVEAEAQFVPALISTAGRDFQALLAQSRRPPPSILLVEDNPANMRVTHALLESLGCRVTPAHNGIEAVALYRQFNFDLVLMDCQMPEMDGYEATRVIRQIEQPQERRTPVIALTAHAMEGSREASLESGMDDQITKPLTMAALTGKLLEWLLPVENADLV